jgi:hypothetical protein
MEMEPNKVLNQIVSKFVVKIIKIASCEKGGGGGDAKGKHDKACFYLLIRWA